MLVLGIVYLFSFIFCCVWCINTFEVKYSRNTATATTTLQLKTFKKDKSIIVCCLFNSDVFFFSVVFLCQSQSQRLVALFFLFKNEINALRTHSVHNLMVLFLAKHEQCSSNTCVSKSNGKLVKQGLNFFSLSHSIILHKSEREARLVSS